MDRDFTPGLDRVTARAGVSPTRFLEEGLRLRLEKRLPEPTTPHAFRVYAADKPERRTWEEIRQIADAEQATHELAKLGLTPHES